MPGDREVTATLIGYIINYKNYIILIILIGYTFDQAILVIPIGYTFNQVKLVTLICLY